MPAGRSSSRRRETFAERRARRAEVDDPAVVMEAAAAFLAVRPRSVAETRRRLRHLGYRHALIEGVLDRLIEVGYLDDAEFARAWVESRDRARPRGESALRRELALKGIDRETTAAVLGDRASEPGADGDTGTDLAAAHRLLERRRTALEREAELRRRRQKVYALLARNGFDPDVCRAATASFMREVATENEIEPSD